MLKNILIIFIAVLLFQKASAQTEKDTLVYFLTKSREIVGHKDSADYIMFNLPADPNTGLYMVIMLNKNGKTLYMTSSKDRSERVFEQGITTTFFPNGKRKSIATYENGIVKGDILKYYPNGKLYAIEHYDFRAKTNVDQIIESFKSALPNIMPVLPDSALLTECRDSTGKVLTENGNGQWKKFSDDFKQVVAEGPVSNGLQEGEWHGNIGDGAKYTCIYRNGKSTSGIGYDKLGKAYPFTKADVDPTYKGGMDEFYKLLGQVVHYPTIDKQNWITGKVFVTFIVEKNGSITDLKLARKPPSETLGAEAIGGVKKSSPWIPGLQYGMPVRVQYTVPVNFTLGN